MKIKIRFYVLALATLATAENIQKPHISKTKTSVSERIITAAPVLHNDLFKRAIATCGFVRGNSGTHVLSDRIQVSDLINSVTPNMPGELQLRADTPRLRVLQQH